MPDMIIAGTGPLYTSILPNILVPDLLAAFKSSTSVLLRYAKSALAITIRCTSEVPS